ncbi:HAD-IC family P-type ATPase [Sorangium sp. So ce295]|uniref:cation-translocating P-type ATPase n=1 Tax=Sorangium sp. So ce295 TaxID=3133295 RepID=UPI003F612F45
MYGLQQGGGGGWRRSRRGRGGRGAAAGADRAQPPAGAAALPGGPGRSAHAAPLEALLAELAVDPGAGLTDEQARERLARFGSNALPEARKASLLALFLRQFRSPLIYLLLGAAALAFSLGERSDAAVILAVVALNGAIGAVQEGRAERSLASLRQLSALTAHVARGGREVFLEARQLVPGDVVVFSAGDAIVADARLLEAAALEVAEAALTGESVPVPKAPGALAPDTPLADRANMVWSGTHVTAGRGRALVVATGVSTEVGKIAALTATGEEPETTLERRIAQLGRYVIAAGVVMCGVVVALGALRGLPLVEVSMIAVSQLVSLIPEGLPVAVTVALALGVRRMAARRAIVRRLSAVESLGSLNVICSDKTGTLTRNEMTVTVLYLPGGRRVEVEGTGYEPSGRLTEDGRAIDAGADADARELLLAGLLCNDAELVPPDDDEPRWRALGDPTEASLLAVAAKGGLDVRAERGRSPRQGEIPFDAATRLMATQHDRGGAPRVLIKGAPESVLELCASVRRGGRAEPLGDGEAREARRAWEDMADRALRVLAIALVDEATIAPQRGYAAFAGRAQLLGLVGQLDPPRPEARGAVLTAQEAGIRPVMVTGDHKATGLAVARALAIAREGDVAVDGRELDALGDDELAGKLARISVFARVHPEQKLRIVEAFQARGDVVAMTGDGVNDAPALARADVGVAMGITGTEVAKGASKIVLTDDNFATLVDAVAEGRHVHRNLKRLILYLGSSSLAEVVALVTALVIGLPVPLVAVQILWVNLVTSGLVTVPLIMGPPEGDEMRLAPVPRGEPLLSSQVLRRMVFIVPAIAASTLGYFAYRLSLGVPLVQARTEAFTVLVVAQWFNVLNCRSDRASGLSLDLAKSRWLIAGLLLGNALHAAVIFAPPLNDVFHTVPLPIQEVAAIGAVGSLVLWVEELRKALARRRERRAP